MAQNTLQISNYAHKETPVSLDRYRENKVSTKFNKPHCIIPVTDMKWVISQVKIVQTLWNECWSSDQFGSRWMKLQTSLSDKSFSVARKILYTSGLFEFKRDTAIDDSRKTVGWLVKNLHGARRTTEFWNKEELETTDQISLVSEITDQNSPRNLSEAEIPPEIVTNDGKKLRISSPKNQISDSNLPSISPETIENIGVSDSLSIPSISSQELLTEVIEEKKETKKHEVLEGLRALGTKAGDKLASAIEARFKLLDSEISEAEYFREKFERQFRWRITQERLTQLMELNSECRAVFFSKFKRLHSFAQLFGSKAFDQAIEGLKECATEIAETAKRQQEYWDVCLSRREQVLGNT